MQTFKRRVATGWKTSIKNAKQFQPFKNCVHVVNCTIKTCKWLLSDRLRFFSLFFANSFKRTFGGGIFHVFFSLIFYLFIFFWREKDGKDEYLEKILLPFTLQSGFCRHSIFCNAVSSFSEELMCSANPVCWLPPYSGGYANSSKPEHFRPIQGPRQHTFHQHLKCEG